MPLVPPAEARLDVVVVGKLIARELQYPIGIDLPLQRHACLGVARVVNDQDANGVGDAFLERNLRAWIAGLIEIAGVGDSEGIDEPEPSGVQQPADGLEEQ